MEKSQIRREIQYKISNIPAKTKKNKDKILFNTMINNPDIKNSSNIMCFVSFNNEVDTHVFIKYLINNKKNVYIPLIDSKNKIMNISKINSFDELEEGYYGILEPKKEFIRIADSSVLDIIITPGVVFSKDNYRIGYGGGYYDKFFSNMNTKALKIGLCYKEQIVKKVPTEKYDVAVDYIIHD